MRSEHAPGGKIDDRRLTPPDASGPSRSWRSPSAWVRLAPVAVDVVVAAAVVGVV